MRQRRQHWISVAALGLAITAGTLAEAQAAGLLESLFGAFRPSPPASVQAYAPDPVTGFLDRLTGQNRPQVAAQGDGGSRGFCVRSCDGSYFPVQSRPGMSAAEACSSFCPASPAKLFSGASIENAVSNDGRRYADTENAFLYRTQLVASCTCNGKSPGGLAAIDVKTDTTLRPGDIVATGTGLVAYTGNRTNKVANFTPIDAARFNKAEREKLANIKIAAPPDEETTASIPADLRAKMPERQQAAR
jgi:hypothetical protein